MIKKALITLLISLFAVVSIAGCSAASTSLAKNS